MSAPNIHPIAPGTIQTRNVLALSTANANRDGTTGAYSTLLTAGANGSLVPNLVANSAVAAAATSTLQVLRAWVQKGGSGNWFLIDEVLLPSVTPNTGVLGAAVTFPKVVNYALGPLDKLGVTQTVAEAVHYSAGPLDY